MIPSLRGKSLLYLPANQFQQSSPHPLFGFPPCGSGPTPPLKSLASKAQWPVPGTQLWLPSLSASIGFDTSQEISTRLMSPKGLSLKSFDQGTTVHSLYSAGPLASFWMFSSKGHRWLGQGTHYTVRRSLVVPPLRWQPMGSGMGRDRYSLVGWGHGQGGEGEAHLWKALGRCHQILLHGGLG